MARKTILVADDDAEWRLAVTSILNCHFDILGYADTGNNVLDMVLDLRPDVVVLDLSMPGMNGFQALSALRLCEAVPIVIILTANSNPAYADKAYRLGAAGYVLKNRASSDLVPAIDAAAAAA